MQQVHKTCFVYTVLFAKISFFKIGKGTVIRNGVFDQSILSWMTLKVHKREIFYGSDFEFFTIS